MNLSLLRPPYADEIHKMAPFGDMQISNLKVQCFYSLHRSDCTSKELGVCTKISVQSIITLVFGYIFLKQIGRVAYICPLDGQIIKQLNSFSNVVITFDTVVSDTWNLHTKSFCSKLRRNLIMISRNSCSNDSFFFGHFLLIGGRSFGPYSGDDNIFILS